MGQGRASLFLDLPFILNNDHRDINKGADNDTGKKVKKRKGRRK